MDHGDGAAAGAARDDGGWEPGFAFKDGWLLQFERRRLSMIRGWPDPAARRRRAGVDTWRGFVPRQRLVQPYRRRRQRSAAPGQLDLPFAEGPQRPRRSLAEQGRRAHDALRFSLPRALARGLERIQRDQFPLLELAAVAPGLDDLLRANPALAFCLAHHPRLRRRQSPLMVASVLALKQAQVLDWLGFPGTPSVARTLRKLEPESLRVDDLPRLRALTRRDEARRAMAHLPRINTGALALLDDDALRAHASPRLLATVAEDLHERYRAETAARLRDTLALARVVRPRRQVGRLESRAQVEALHHELAERYVRQKRSHILEQRFPAPPVPGQAGIVPLTSPAMLLDEGAQQHNCVASYARAVAAREVFIYRVLAPARATLALRPGAHGSWGVSELLGPCNQPVAPAVERAVRDWLARHEDAG